MQTACIALGSNLGDRNKNIQEAISRLKSRPSIKIVKISSIIETDSEGGPKQPKFLNGVLKLETKLSPFSLLKFLQKIESDLGRVRTVKNGPRIIDLDILFYGDTVLKSQNLEIPHPRLHKRRFVLEPLCEIAPDFIHPVLKKKVKDLL